MRTVSRHGLAYMLCSISEMFRHYAFDPIDLLVIHAILNGNVLKVMQDSELDRQYGSVHSVEPDAIKQGVTRGSLSRFLNLPLETVRRRVNALKERGILAERIDGVIVTEDNAYKFGNNHALQQTNIIFLKRFLRDLARAGVRGADDL